MKLKLYTDPMAEIGSFKFSDLFNEDAPIRPTAETDFTIEVWRSGHQNASGDRTAAFRRNPKALKRITKLIKEAQKRLEGKSEGEAIETEGEEFWLEFLADFAGEAESWTEDEKEAFAAVMGGNVKSLVCDVIDLPVEDEAGGVKKVKLSDTPDDFSAGVDALLQAHPDMANKIREVAQEKEKEFTSYLKSAKNVSAPTSTIRRGGPATKSDSSGVIESASTSN